MPATVETPLVLKKLQVAALLQISERKLEMMVRDSGFPAPIKIGGNVRWRRETVVAWLDSKEQA